MGLSWWDKLWTVFWTAVFGVSLLAAVCSGLQGLGTGGVVALAVFVVGIAVSIAVYIFLNRSSPTELPDIHSTQLSVSRTQPAPSSIQDPGARVGDARIYPEYPVDWVELKRQVLARDDYECGNCGGTGEMHVHHIVPLSKGGTNQLSNMKTLCKECHERIHPHMKYQVRDFD
jgi:5-methylcytosine-specific restriction endonuclease McrA